MQKLVFGLIAGLAASAGGCVASSDDVGIINAQWSFATVDGISGNLSTIPTCPPNGPTAAVHTTRLVGGIPDASTEKIDLFNCSDFSGALTRAPGAYETFVAITSDGGGTVYGNSLAAVVDITAADKTFAVKLVDNGGYFQFD